MLLLIFSQQLFSFSLKQQQAMIKVAIKKIPSPTVVPMIIAALWLLLKQLLRVS
jgi:hypothetical protein